MLQREHSASCSGRMGPVASGEYYHSCARCGWRGILRPGGEHDCGVIGGVRVAAAIARSDARTAEIRERAFVASPARADDALRSMCDAFSGLLGRHVRFTGWQGGLGQIEQRCAGCGATIEIKQSFAGVEAMGTEAALRIGDAVRKRYLLHRCEPVAQTLVGLTYAELEELHASLERESVRLMERAAEIDKLQKARAG